MLSMNDARVDYSVTERDDPICFPGDFLTMRDKNKGGMPLAVEPEKQIQDGPAVC